LGGKSKAQGKNRDEEFIEEREKQVRGSRKDYSRKIRSRRRERKWDGRKEEQQKKKAMRKGDRGCDEGEER